MKKGKYGLHLVVGTSVMYQTEGAEEEVKVVTQSPMFTYTTILHKGIEKSVLTKLLRIKPMETKRLTNEEILQAIADNFLCVRRLPFEVINYWSYKEGDENKKYVDADGKPIEFKREVVVQNLDLEYFQKEKTTRYNTDTPEQRFERWKKQFPNGRKLLKETKTVKNGGWWYVKQIKNTDSTVRFNRENDKFFAPTLGEAVQLYLESLK